MRQERTLRRAQCGPCVPLLATYGDATAFEMRTLGEGAAGDAGRPLLFDRVLCDVPCGGDGTLRKSPSKLSRWSVAAGLGAHALQLAASARSRKGVLTDLQAHLLSAPDPTCAIRIQRIYFGAEYAREYAYSLRPSTR